jgi:hypothetical protein
MSGISILVSDSHGIYIPQVFSETFEGWNGIEPTDLEALNEGPEHEWYWEAWQSILSNAWRVDECGREWHLYQDGDLFAYCEQHMTDEEYKEFFGEERC